MPQLSDFFDEDHWPHVKETYVENIVSWATLPDDKAKAETEARTRRLLNLLFGEGGDDVGSEIG